MTADEIRNAKVGDDLYVIQKVCTKYTYGEPWYEAQVYWCRFIAGDEDQIAVGVDGEIVFARPDLIFVGEREAEALAAKIEFNCPVESREWGYDD